MVSHAGIVWKRVARCLAAASLLAGTAALAAADSSSQIKKNWETFFSPSTPVDQRVGLLQDGKDFKQALEQGSQSPMAKQSSVTVDHVKVEGKRADVRYTIDVAGQPALKDQPGVAVKEGGTWKVSKDTFCHLEQMHQRVPPPCSASNR